MGVSQISLRAAIGCLLLGLMHCHPHHHHLMDERSNMYYTDRQQQLPSAAQSYQLPASTQLLPNNVKSGSRYGQQPMMLMVPKDSRFVYEPAGSAGSAQQQSSYLEPFHDLGNSGGRFPFTYGQQQGAGAAHQSDADAVQVSVLAASQQPQYYQQQQAVPQQYYQQEQAAPQQYYQQQQAAPQQYYQQEQSFPQQLAVQQMQYLQDEAQRQKFMLMASQTQSQLASQASPNDFLYYNFPIQQNQLQRDRLKPSQQQAYGFEKLLLRSGQEQNNASGSGATGAPQEKPTTTGQPPYQEEIGPSIAQAKPQAISVAGPGGVAAAAPIGTAIVGPGGMALSAPSATALAGTRPKPGGSQEQIGKLRHALAPFAHY